MSAVLIFGEILFDRFPTGETVLGGAPANVAWHLNALGLPATLLSRLGEDALGEKARSVLRHAGLDDTCIQADAEHPTGTVDVHIEQGSPRFDIIDQVAYDYIEPPSAALFRDRFSLLYHGTLALRNPISAQTLRTLRAQVQCPVFVDVNLRAPFWTQATVMSSIEHATYVKLNHEELALLTGGQVSGQRDIWIQSAQQFRQQTGLKALIVTCGAQGAFIVTAADIYDMQPFIPERIVDTVGAGDAFSALCIAGLMQNWDYQRILKQASQFAARVCGIRGAIPGPEFIYPDLCELTTR
jgi:fructokinase